MWLSRVKYRIGAAFVCFELECTGWWSAWELPAYQISASNSNSVDLNLRQTPKTKMLSRVEIPKITAVPLFSWKIICGCLVFVLSFFVEFFLLLLNFFLLFLWNFVEFLWNLLFLLLGKIILIFFSTTKKWMLSRFDFRALYLELFFQDNPIFNPAQPHI